MLARGTHHDGQKRDRHKACASWIATPSMRDAAPMQVEYAQWLGFSRRREVPQQSQHRRVPATPILRTCLWRCCPPRSMTPQSIPH